MTQSTDSRNWRIWTPFSAEFSGQLPTPETGDADENSFFAIDIMPLCIPFRALTNGSMT
jgi:hypothetical protein